jgi:plastocyanin
MLRQSIAVGLAVGALAVSACGGHAPSGNVIPMGGNAVMLPSFDKDLVVFAKVPKDTIGEELPSEGLGSIKSPKWNANLGGFTQQSRSQKLAFPPGTKITIRNLSKNITHTLDVVKEISGPPAHFPKNPNLSIKAKGHGKLEAGYASGPIEPGKSVTVTLVKKGTYLIGCAFHYGLGMHDVITVAKHALPGQQATPLPSTRPSPTPTSRSSYSPYNP